MTTFSERFTQIERKLYGKARDLFTFGTDDLADDSVTTAKIGAAQVTATELAGASVSTAKIQDDAVTLAKIAHEAWTQWTPTAYQSVSVTCAANGSTQYIKYGRTVIVSYAASLTSTGTASQPIRISVPHSMTSNTSILGVGRFTDASAGHLIYPVTFDYYDTNSVVLSVSTGSGIGAWWLGTVGFTGAVAASDGISGFMVYQSTS